jgi:hypothetical protein
MNMKNWWVIVCLMPLSFFGQDSTSKWLMGASAQVGVLGRWTRLETGPEALKERIDESEQWGSAWALRAVAEYTSGKRWSFQTGFGMSSGFYGIDTIAEAGMYDVRYRYTFMDVPIGISSHWLSLGKWTMRGEAGLVASMLIRQRTHYLFIGLADGDDWEEPNLHQFYPGVYGEIAFRKEIYDRTFLSFGVRMQQLLLPTSSDPLQRYLYQGGLNITFVRRIGG